MLNLERIESGNREFSLSKVSPLPIAEGVIEMMENHAREQDVSVSLSSDLSQCPDIWVDQIRFRQILLNLTSNAIKYNRPGGSACLIVRPGTANHVRFEVIDTGMGIAAAKQSEIFQP